MSTIAADFTERYDLVEALSGNALFAVYRARERATGLFFLLKTPRAHILEDERPVNLFRELMFRVQEVDNPAMARIHEVGGTGTDLWIVSEMVDAPTIRQILSDGLSLERALDVIAQAADALEAVHQANIYHGDVSPRHLHILEDGSIRLTDAGMASLSEVIQPFMRVSLQTPHPAYLAPEVLRGSPPSAQTDVYSLAMMLYEMTTGHLPFPGNSIDTVRAKQEETPVTEPTLLYPALPQDLNALMAKAMAWEPEERFSSAAAMAAEIRVLRDRLSPDQSAVIVPPASIREEIRKDQVQPHAGTAFGTASLGSGVRICSECLAANASDAVNCSSCWNDLESIAILTPEEGRGFARRSRRRSRRRRFIRRGLLVLGASALVALYLFDRNVPPGLLTGAPTSTATADQGEGLWTSPRNGAASTGSITGATVVPSGTIRWQRELGAEVVSSPAVADGRIFLTTRDRRIIALSAFDGTTIWEIPATGPLDTSPIVADGLVYVVFRDSSLVVLDAATGERAWTEDYNLSNPLFSWVTVDQGIVFALSQDGTIQTLDAKTGELRWEVDSGVTFLSPPAVSEGRLMAASLNREILVLDSRSGQTRLVYVLQGIVDTSPAILGNVAIIGGSDSAVRAIDVHAQNIPLEKTVLRWWSQLFFWGMAPFPPAQSGVIWTRSVGEEIRTSIAVSANRAVVTTDKGTLLALRMSNGDEVWRTSLEEEPAAAGSPIIINDTIFVGTERGNLHAHSVRDGSRLWTLALDSAVLGSPAFADGDLYVVTRAGVVYAVD